MVTETKCKTFSGGILTLYHVDEKPWKVTRLPLTSQPIIDIIKETEDYCNYAKDSVKIYLQIKRTESAVIDLNNYKDKTFEEIGLVFPPKCVSKLFLLVTENELPPDYKIVLPSAEVVQSITSDFDEELDMDASASPTSSTCETYDIHFHDRSFNFKKPVKPGTRYVGLVNQAMTCYLNSLLQALYMTPEFRNALYEWQYNEGMPYELQKLFLNLQTSTKVAVETTALTKSFGWNCSEAWQQHDVQELCRVMFDALEQRLKNTNDADLINRLYEGKMIDYVKCLECGTEKSREDTFLDIPLPVKPFGSSVAYNSVEEALRAFVQYETLDGINQYHCEKCNKKCNAHKGLKFTKFPYLLTLHLKRFDFDYQTFHRIKLNDKVTFPKILHLNSFIATASNSESPGAEEESSFGAKCDDSSTTDSGTLDDDCPYDNSMTNSNHSTNHDHEDDEGIDVCNGPSTSNCSTNNHENDRNRGRHETGKGPYEYDLFSIMIHSGSASGGHYYAYIKDFKTDYWYCFNDQNVSRITDEDIEKTYGGGSSRTYYSGAYSSSTNAYMLMYRQIDPERNKLPMQEENFPPHIKDLLVKMKESEDNERRNRENQINQYKFRVYYRHPTEGKLLNVQVYSPPDETLSSLTDSAYRRTGYDAVVNFNQCRLVAYDSANDFIEYSFVDKDEEILSNISELGQTSVLFLEVRQKDETFEVYKPGGIAVKVFVVDVGKKDVIKGPIRVRCLHVDTVKNFKEILGKRLNMNPKALKVILTLQQTGIKLLDNDESTLKDEGFNHLSKVFVSTTLDTDSSKEFSESALYALIKDVEYIISLHVQLPEVNREILEELNIPPLEEIRNKETEKVTNGPSKLDATEVVKESPEESNTEATVPKGPTTSSSKDTPVRNISPQLQCETWGRVSHEQSNSEDSSLSDSDRTLVGDPEDENPPAPRREMFRKSQARSQRHITQLLKECLSNYNEEERCSIDQFDTENSDNEDDVYYYFKVVPETHNSVGYYCSSEATSSSNQRLLTVLVDKRMQLQRLKRSLEPFVGVPNEYFKVFRQTLDHFETECTRLTESLRNYDDDERFVLQLGRVLRPDEVKLKVFQLLIEADAAQPFKSLFEIIVSKETTVSQMKNEILAEYKRKYNVEIPYERCRLRKKVCKMVGKVFLDDQSLRDIQLWTSHEILLQELPDKETVYNDNQIALFVRRWLPSEIRYCDIEDVVLDGRSFGELKEKISSISNIPEKYVEVARGKPTFPDHINALRVSALEWTNSETSNDMQIDTSPLMVEDGCHLFYRDSREELKTLSHEETFELGRSEIKRLQAFFPAHSHRPSNYSRQEKALTIRVDTK